MKKLLVVNVIVILAVVALTAGATYAYFSAQDQTKQAEITTAKLGVEGVFSTPLSFPKMLPGDSVVKWIAIKNTSADAYEDFYLQMIPESPSGDTNFCYKKDGANWLWDPKVWLKIEDGSTVRYDNWICFLYPVNNAGEGGKVIAMLADDVAPGASKTLKVTLTLSTTTGNFFQDKNNKDTMNLIAVQWNGPAPQVSYGQVWPNGDANYGN